MLLFCQNYWSIADAHTRCPLVFGVIARLKRNLSQMYPSAYAFPFGQQTERDFHPPQMSLHALLQNPNGMSLDMD